MIERHWSDWIAWRWRRERKRVKNAGEIFYWQEERDAGKTWRQFIDDVEWVARLTAEEDKDKFLVKTKSSEKSLQLQLTHFFSHNLFVVTRVTCNMSTLRLKLIQLVEREGHDGSNWQADGGLPTFNCFHVKRKKSIRKTRIENFDFLVSVFMQI